MKTFKPFDNLTLIVKYIIVCGLLLISYNPCKSSVNYNSLLTFSDDVKYSHQKFFTLGHRDFKRFITSYKDALLFSNSVSEIDEVNNLIFAEKQYFEFSFISKKPLSDPQSNFTFSFEGNDKIDKIYKWVVKESQYTSYGPIVQYVYRFVIKTATPASSTLKVAFPDNSTKTHTP